MQRQDVAKHTEEALSCPILSQRLLNVVNEIESTDTPPRVKKALYELVDVMLQMGQRVRALEMRVVPNSVQDELDMRNARIPERRIDYVKDFPRDTEHAQYRK